ncbi:hypothetical protein BX666DRAFT_1878730 [Dichotomocladium elegans]|nr:hypothetical protein BX666DRAFT_1878730 [Dichotomocladium elegans]
MSSLLSNRFDALLGDEETDTDKLGNTKPATPSDEPPRSKRDGARKVHGRVAGKCDNEKKINQGWGRAERAQEDAANDVLSPDDPAAEGGVQSGTQTPSSEANFMTLDEYLQSQAALNERFRKLEVRPPNEGSDNSQWKDTVPFEREDKDDFYFSGKEKDAKQKTKNKKEKVYLELDHPPHRPSGRGGRGRGGRGRGGRGGNRGRGGRQNNTNINLSDDRAFPTLQA